MPIPQLLHEQVVNNTSVHVGQSEIATVVPIRELHVIEAEQMKDRGVKIMMRDWGFNGMHSKVVGGTISEAAFDPAAGQPHRKSVVVMPTPERRSSQFAKGFFKWSPSKLRDPHDQRLVQQAPRFQIRDECRNALVGFGGVGAVILDQAAAVSVSVPAPSLGAIKYLDESHAAFNQSSSGEALIAERSISVELAYAFRLAAQVE